MMDLFLLPFAGGTSLIYEEWIFNSSINAIPIDYKGHGFRMREPLYNTFEEMVTDIAEQIKSKMKNNDISILGHSMGGLVAWDVANELVCSGVAVKSIIVSSCLPPHLFNEKLYRKMATEIWLKDFLSKFSRVKIGRMDSKYFRKNIFPAIQNDYRLISIHKHEKRKELNFSIACFYGESDNLMPSNGMEKWNEYTSRNFLLLKFKGGHFYIEDNDNRDNLISAIETFLLYKNFAKN